MGEKYEAHGIQFVYPSDWEISEQQPDENEIVITVQSSETSFWLLTLLFDRPEPKRIADAALDAFRQEYDDLDIYSAEETVCHQKTEAWDVEFRCLEIYNSAWIRAFLTEQFSVLLLSQANDQEIPETEEILKNITRSFCCPET